MQFNFDRRLPKIFCEYRKFEICERVTRKCTEHSILRDRTLNNSRILLCFAIFPWITFCKFLRQTHKRPQANNDTPAKEEKKNTATNVDAQIFSY